MATKDIYQSSEGRRIKSLFLIYSFARMNTR
jgi:hypothetical protein